MAIKIGHASADENYRAVGGWSGDQTGGEVCVRTWYSSPWDYVLRFKDRAKAKKAAAAMYAACNNPNIGYDQGNRNDALIQAKKHAWDLGAVDTPTEVDCSSLVTLCAQCAGVDVPYVWGNAPYTGNMETQFMKTGEFEKLSDLKFRVSDSYLMEGDILVKISGHTAMVLENGARAGEYAEAEKESVKADNKVPSGGVKIDPAYKFDNVYARAYTVTASALNLRSGADITKTILKVLPKGSRVTCYGYYNKKLDDVWLFVQTADGTTGYCSKQYLE